MVAGDGGTTTTALFLKFDPCVLIHKIEKSFSSQQLKRKIHVSRHATHTKTNHATLTDRARRPSKKNSYLKLSWCTFYDKVCSTSLKYYIKNCVAVLEPRPKVPQFHFTYTYTSTFQDILPYVYYYIFTKFTCLRKMFL